MTSKEITYLIQMHAFPVLQPETLRILKICEALNARIDELQVQPTTSKARADMETVVALENLRAGVRGVIAECNCRAEHGAEGAEHLLEIEKMLRRALQ